MVKVENVDKLIRLIQISNSFDMRNWSWGKGRLADNKKHACGTPACIAGHIDFLGDIKTFGEVRDIDRASWLGTHLANSYDMFAPSLPRANFRSERGELGHITKKMAIKMLKHFRETGEVQW